MNATLKRSKKQDDLFMIELGDCSSGPFTSRQLYQALDSKPLDVFLVWENNATSSEKLVVVDRSYFVGFDQLKPVYETSLLLKAQGIPESAQIAMDLRRYHEGQKPLIKQIIIGSESAQPLMVILDELVAKADRLDEHEDEDLLDEDEEEEMSDADVEAWLSSPEVYRKQLHSWGYVSEDWLCTLTDEEVATIHFEQVGVDEGDHEEITEQDFF